MRSRLPAAALCLSAFLLSGVALGQEAPAEFTFLFWTDQELRGGDDVAADLARVAPIVDAMNTIAGTVYPAAIGGTVDAPDFIASGGDTTAWPSWSAVHDVWDEIVNNRLIYPTRAVAGNHDSGGGFSANTFYDWLRADSWIASHTSDNGQPAWNFNPPAAADDAVTGSGIIPGINYSFKHKGVIIIGWSPAYWGNGAPVGSSYLNQYDLAWLSAELAKYGASEPKVVINHLNYGSLENRSHLDTLFEANNVLLMLSGHWEKIQHWAGTSSVTDYVMDEGCRGDPWNASFSVVHFGRDRLTLAHYEAGTGAWDANTAHIIDRTIPERWTEGPQPVAITTQPADQVVAESDTAIFTVAATGDAPLSYQWQVDAGAGWQDIAGADQSSYTTPTTTLADNGDRYRCVVSNETPSEATSNAATLTVQAPTIIVAALTGGPYKGKQDVTITWAGTFSRDVKIEFTDDNWSTSTEVVGSTTNSGSYVCELENVTSTQCAFRVSDAADGDPAGQSGVFSITAITDADGDRLDDDWEESYWDDLTVSGGATSDSDGDGLTDLEEFWQGKDPTVYDASGGTTNTGVCTPGTGSAATAVGLGLPLLLARRRRRQAFGW